MFNCASPVITKLVSLICNIVSERIKVSSLYLHASCHAGLYNASLEANLAHHSPSSNGTALDFMRVDIKVHIKYAWCKFSFNDIHLFQISHKDFIALHKYP